MYGVPALRERPPAAPLGIMLPVLLLLGAYSAAADPKEADAWRLSEAQRLRDLQLASGLLGSQAERDEAKYNPTAGTMSAFPNGTSGTFFSGVFSDHAVLQRGPSKSAVYGVVFGAQPATEVDVVVASVSGSGDVTDSYTVKAVVMLTDRTYPGGRYAQWKAFLKPAPAGGNFTITAGCSSCQNTTAKAAIADVTFGDGAPRPTVYIPPPAASTFTSPRADPAAAAFQSGSAPGRATCGCR